MILWNVILRHLNKTIQYSARNIDNVWLVWTDDVQGTSAGAAKMTLNRPIGFCITIGVDTDFRAIIECQGRPREMDVCSERAATPLLAVVAVADNHPDWSVCNGEGGSAAET